MKENKYQKTITQLESLIDDRKSFITGDEEFDSVFHEDIKALKNAIEALKEVSNNYTRCTFCVINSLISGFVLGMSILTIIRLFL